MVSTSTPRADGVLDDGPDGLHPGRVALGLGHAVRARPAAIAVHDDGDVAGHRDPRAVMVGQPRSSCAVATDGAVT